MLTLLIPFFCFMLLGMPISFCMMTSALIYFGANSISLLTAVQTMTSSIGESFSIIAIPFFILSANIMNSSGITKKLFGFADTAVGWIPGGLGHVNILSSVIFAGMSGAAVADAGGLGSIELEAMREAGYDDDFSLAITGASSTIGPIIPPSIPAVTAGVAGGISVGALFVAGIVPGILMAVAMGIVVFFHSKKMNYRVNSFPTGRQLWKSFADAFFALLTPVILIGGIMGGIFTPTEAASVCVLYALILSFVTKEIKAKDIPRYLRQTIENTVSITFIIAAASLFSYVLTIEQVPKMMTLFFMNNVHSKVAALLLINLMLLFVGMLMETMAALTIMTPILLPIAVAFGVQPVQFGLVLILNLMIGLLTPPVGSVLYVLSSISDVSVERIARASLPYIAILVVVLLAITFIPTLTLFLPKLAGLV